MILAANALGWVNTGNAGIIIAVLLGTYIAITKILEWKYKIDGQQIQISKAASFFESLGLDYLPRICYAVGSSSVKRGRRAISEFVDEIDTKEEREALAVKTLKNVIRASRAYPKRVAAMQEAFAEIITNPPADAPTPPQTP
jgi:hypothetical protein